MCHLNQWSPFHDNVRLQCAGAFNGMFLSFSSHSLVLAFTIHMEHCSNIYFPTRWIFHWKDWKALCMSHLFRIQCSKLDVGWSLKTWHRSTLHCNWIQFQCNIKYNSLPENTEISWQHRSSKVSCVLWPEFYDTFHWMVFCVE